MPEFRVLTAGDTALVVEFGDGVDRRISSLVLALARRLDEVRLEGIVETVPTFRSLMVHYDPILVPTDSLVRQIVELVKGLRAAEQPGRLWRLPVCYHADMAPDLDEVAARAGLTPGQVIERHAGVVYHVYMLGFLPGLAYMGDVPAELVLPRRVTPRTKIPAGSLGIAMAMSLIMPRETPSGLNLIGRSPVAMWRGQKKAGAEQAEQSALLVPGDSVIYEPISLREYDTLAARAAAGTLDLTPVNEPAGVAA